MEEGFLRTYPLKDNGGQILGFTGEDRKSADSHKQKENGFQHAE